MIIYIYFFRYEVKAVKKALAHLWKDKPIILTYILVTKRINTRIFMRQNRDNPGPGVVVDDVITLPEKYDFYLISQHCKQGTVSPTCYNIIEDNSGWPPGQFQRMTFMLCHLYYNFSVSGFSNLLFLLLIFFFSGFSTGASSCTVRSPTCLYGIAVFACRAPCSLKQPSIFHLILTTFFYFGVFLKQKNAQPFLF